MRLPAIATLVIEAGTVMAAVVAAKNFAIQLQPILKRVAGRSQANDRPAG